MKQHLLLLSFLFVVGCLSAQNTVVISKKSLNVYVISNQSDTLCTFRCACGKNKGNKRCNGDYRTPEGVFQVASIENSKYWRYKGGARNVYGPYFIRLKVPKWKGIGIHGTNAPKTIGTRCTKGCIRLKNKDILQLVQYVDVGTKVHILSDYSSR
jgi:lipoprotein-anchoring transpeptidase ErfK/SrfK